MDTTEGENEIESASFNNSNQDLSYNIHREDNNLVASDDSLSTFSGKADGNIPNKEIQLDSQSIIEIVHENIHINGTIVEYCMEKELEVDYESVDENLEETYAIKLLEYKKVKKKVYDDIKMCKNAVKHTKADLEKVKTETSKEINYIIGNMKKTAKLYKVKRQKILSDKVIDKCISELLNKVEDVSKASLENENCKSLLNSDKIKLDAYSTTDDLSVISEFARLERENQAYDKEIEEYEKRYGALLQCQLDQNLKLGQMKEKLISINQKCDKAESAFKESKADLKQKYKTLNKLMERKNTLIATGECLSTEYLTKKPLIEDFEKNATRLEEMKKELVILKNKSPRKKKKTNIPTKDNNEKLVSIRIKPRFHRTAVLKPSV